MVTVKVVDEAKLEITFMKTSSLSRKTFVVQISDVQIEKK